MTYPDVIIIGGGIVGCASAYYLTQAGVRVHLLERGALGSAASKAGMTHIVTWEEPETHLLLSRESKHLYQELSQVLPIDIQYRETGSIAIVEQPEKMTSFGEAVRRLQAWGVKCHILNPDELIAMEPRIAADVGGGAYFEDDAQVNPLYTTHALARAAQEYGAVIETFCEAIGIEHSPNQQRVTAVQTPQGRIPAGNVVIAAGAWSGQLAKSINLEVPILPRKGTLVVTAPLPEDYFACKIVLSAGYMDSVREGASSGVAVAANVQQVKNGNLILGSSRQFVGFDASVDPAVVSSMMKRNLRFFPDLANVTAIRTWAGFRPYTPDLLPIISAVDGIEGLYIAAGHEGVGITEAPITGKLISQLITRETTDIPIGDLSFSRFNKLS